MCRSPDLPGYADGEWWVQDAAAALPARLLTVAPGERAVDLCAAPGGKCAQLALAGAVVSAVDRSAQRLKRLSVNLARLKLPAELVVANATDRSTRRRSTPSCSTRRAARPAPSAAIPMSPGPSGPATSRASPNCRASFSIARSALTRRGGLIVYCTCSLEPEEGEAQIAALLRRNPDVRRVPIEASEIGGLAECVTPLGDLRTLPCHLPAPTPRQSGLDGFFAARLQRRE